MLIIKIIVVLQLLILLFFFSPVVIDLFRKKYNKVCAYCGKKMGYNKNIKEVSHGICSDCLKKEMQKL